MGKENRLRYAQWPARYRERHRAFNDLWWRHSIKPSLRFSVKLKLHWTYVSEFILTQHPTLNWRRAKLFLNGLFIKVCMPPKRSFLLLSYSMTFSVCSSDYAPCDGLEEACNSDGNCECSPNHTRDTFGNCIHGNPSIMSLHNSILEPT